MAARLPGGKFLAANDPMAFAFTGYGATSRRISAHLSSLGFTDAQSHNYFNSGVIRASRSSWARVENAALQLHDEQARGRPFLDQDILNLAAADDRLPMSLKWNFPIFLLNAGVQEVIVPRIYHFMSQPKPWDGVFSPWNRDLLRPYLDTARRYPSMSKYVLTMTRLTSARYQLQQRYKQVVETFGWRLSAKRSAILNHDRNAAKLEASWFQHSVL